MDDNKDIEKVSRTVFDKFRIETPDDAWDKLGADLDKKQAVVYKQRANRFKLLSIALLLIIFSFVTWQYLIPTLTTNNLAGAIAVKKVISNKASSNHIVTEKISTSNLPAENLITSEKINESTSSKENNSNPKINKSQIAFQVQIGLHWKMLRIIFLKKVKIGGLWGQIALSTNNSPHPPWLKASSRQPVFAGTE